MNTRRLCSLLLALPFSLPAFAGDECADPGVPLVSDVGFLPSMEDQEDIAGVQVTDVQGVPLDVSGGGDPVEPPPAPSGTVTFDAGWGETLEGRLQPGEPVRIVYSPDRAGLRYYEGGAPGWGVEGYALFTLSDGTRQTARFNPIGFESVDGSYQPFALPTDVLVPAETEAVEFYFLNYAYGDRRTERYDSDYGANYPFDVTEAGGGGGGGAYIDEDGQIQIVEPEERPPPPPPTATVTFDGDWGEQATGQLTGGQSVRIDYDVERAGLTPPDADWGVDGYAQFKFADGTFETARFDALDEPAVAIPREAVAVDFWFLSWAAGEPGGEQYDSDFGANYTFVIQPAAPGITFGPGDGRPAPVVRGQLIAGDTYDVTYDPERASHQGAGDDEAPSWHVDGYALIHHADGSTSTSTWPAVGFEGGAEGLRAIAAPKRLALPDDAAAVELWFVNWTDDGAVDYDTNGGWNYRWDVSSDGS